MVGKICHLLRMMKKFKYNEIWEVVRKILKVNFTVNPIPDDKYITVK